MRALLSATIVLGFTLSLVLSGCDTKSADNGHSSDIDSDSALSTTQQPNDTNNLGKQNIELARVYSQAIGDYIRLVNEEYNLTFDTLFFGKHQNAQPTDFPDIELPTTIANTKIKLISPEEGEESQREKKSSFYINLFGSVSSDHADFILLHFQTDLLINMTVL